MWKSLIVAAVVVVGVAFAATDAEWTVYKAKHGKVYGLEQDYFRRKVFESNQEKIRHHNGLYAKRLRNYYLQENQYADMTHEDFVKTMNGYRKSQMMRKGVQFHRSSNLTIPSEVNWVNDGLVTAVKNQGECGSCWSFSTTGAVEGAHAKATGNLVSLSEENLMDCSSKYGNEGCNGGLMDDAFQYIIDNKGIDTEKSYPYKAKVNKCHFKKADVGASISSFRDIEEGSESSLKEAVATTGPVSIAIDASRDSFMLYGGGVYYDPMCSSTRVDHAVLVVGYGTHEGKDYWLVKNSWGESWGESGYVKMSRNEDNNCGIATQASYPIV